MNKLKDQGKKSHMIRKNNLNRRKKKSILKSILWFLLGRQYVISYDDYFKLRDLLNDDQTIFYFMSFINLIILFFVKKFIN